MSMPVATDWQLLAEKLARDLETITNELRDTAQRLFDQREVMAEDLRERRARELAAFRAGYLDNRAYTGRGGAGDEATEHYVVHAFEEWRKGEPR